MRSAPVVKKGAFMGLISISWSERKDIYHVSFCIFLIKLFSPQEANLSNKEPELPFKCFLYLICLYLFVPMSFRSIYFLREKEVMHF